LLELFAELASLQIHPGWRCLLYCGSILLILGKEHLFEVVLEGHSLFALEVGVPVGDVQERVLDVWLRPGLRLE